MEKDNYLLWYNLGITYRDAGDLEAATAALQKAYLIKPEDESLLESLTTIYYTIENFPEAFRYASEALSINPDNYRVWNTLGVLYFNQSDFETACEAFEQAVARNPYYYDALYNLRDCYEELGNETGADECEKRMKEIPFHD